MVPDRGDPHDQVGRHTDDYTLVVTARTSGFFSNFNRVVNHLSHTLGTDGCRAVRVEWRADEARGEPGEPFAYGTAGDGNVWDHFFEPLNFADPPSLERRTDEFADHLMTGLGAYSMYESGDLWRHLYNAVLRAHVRVRMDIARRAEAIWKERMADAFCVGVHYRHPGHDLEMPGPAPPISAFVAQTRRLLPDQGPYGVVLATDVTEAVDQFAEAFGEALIIQPGVFRSTLAGTSLHHWPVVPRLELGEQVLIDALLLGSCDTLLHVTSNIATAVGYMNPELTMVYCDADLGDRRSERALPAGASRRHARLGEAIVYPHLGAPGFGRLGNQLWEIAGTLGIAASTEKEARFPPWEPAPWFCIPYRYFTSSPLQGTDAATIPNHLPERHRKYLQDPGLWRSIEDQIRRYFGPSDAVRATIETAHPEFFGLADRVALHVRRGDYLEQAEFFPQPTNAYFRTALEMVEGRPVVVFSDDIEWCRTHLEWARPAMFMSGGAAHEDLFMMASSAHHILSNSSFSWWGAFLSSDPRPIYPVNWYGEGYRDVDATLLFLDGWIGVDER